MKDIYYSDTYLLISFSDSENDLEENWTLFAQQDIETLQEYIKSVIHNDKMINDPDYWNKVEIETGKFEDLRRVLEYKRNLGYKCTFSNKFTLKGVLSLMATAVTYANGYEVIPTYYNLKSYFKQNIPEICKYI